VHCLDLCLMCFGKFQVLGIVDSGIDMDSCYFFDPDVVSVVICFC
jgi:hypothetical protein